jgi:hypothetical protein
MVLDAKVTAADGQLTPFRVATVNSVDWAAAANACSAQESPQPSLPPDPEEAQER